MFTIKSITIEGVQGDVEIALTDEGALVTTGSRVLCQVGRDEAPEARYEKVREVAKVVYGADRRNIRANATTEMIRDLLQQIERIAGC